MGRSDSRSALPRFTGPPLIGLAAPRPPRGWHPRSLTAGAETGLSCSHDGSPTVPRPLRRRIPRCCSSKCFTPSLAFARGCRARLPVVPLAGVLLTTRQASLHAADRRVASAHGGLDPALRRPGLPKRRRAATRVSWHLPRPDLHRLVVVSFQDAPTPKKTDLGKQNDHLGRRRTPHRQQASGPPARSPNLPTTQVGVVWGRSIPIATRPPRSGGARRDQVRADRRRSRPRQ